MKQYENERFDKYGSSFFLLLLGLGVVLPFVISLILCIPDEEFRLNVFLPLGLVFMFIAWMFLIMMIAYGHLTSFFVKRTSQKINDLPYQFNSSFRGRNGILYIDVENGMIGFISAYNPFEIQVFNASRIDRAQTIASTMKGVRFDFYLDGKKLTMYTLLSNRAVNLKSNIGAEAISKADTFVNLLMAAKKRAERVM